jgi:hypothetical protein
MTGTLAALKHSLRRFVSQRLAWPGDVYRTVAPRGGGCSKENAMKRFVMLTVLLATIAATFAAMTPASADKHGDRMKRDCATGARKC